MRPALAHQRGPRRYPAPVSATHEIGEARETAARVSDRATENTSKLWGISLNSLLPGSATHQNGEFRDRAGEALTLLGASVGARRAARPRLPHQAVAEDQVRPSEGGRDTISRNRLFPSTGDSAHGPSATNAGRNACGTRPQLR